MALLQGCPEVDQALIPGNSTMIEATATDVSREMYSDSHRPIGWDYPGDASLLIPLPDWYWHVNTE